MGGRIPIHKLDIDLRILDLSTSQTIDTNHIQSRIWVNLVSSPHINLIQNKDIFRPAQQQQKTTKRLDNVKVSTRGVNDVHHVRNTPDNCMGGGIFHFIILHG